MITCTASRALSLCTIFGNCYLPFETVTEKLLLCISNPFPQSLFPVAKRTEHSFGLWEIWTCYNKAQVSFKNSLRNESYKQIYIVRMQIVFSQPYCILSRMPQAVCQLKQESTRMQSSTCDQGNVTRSLNKCLEKTYDILLVKKEGYYRNLQLKSVTNNTIKE